MLEAVFLTKLMQKFGLTDAQAKQLLTDARPATAPAQVADTSDGAATLQLAESFDRAWLRVGLALDRTNFTVDNRDREKGMYTVRYANSMEELKRDGLFGKLFYGGPSAAKPGRSSWSTCARRATAARRSRSSMRTARSTTRRMRSESFRCSTRS